MTGQAPLSPLASGARRAFATVIVSFALLTSGLALALAVSADSHSPTTVGLGTAGDFAVLAGSTITDAGISDIDGDVGLSPASGTFIGLTCVQVDGTIYAVDALGNPCFEENAGLLTTAKNNLTTAYNDADGRSPTLTYSEGDNQLGGKTLEAGVYSFGGASTANLIGDLTLDGSASDVWIFQASSTLVTAADSSVRFIGGAQACNVFWQVSSSATIGTRTDFAGTIMADQMIALQRDATLEGRALARVTQVTLDNNTISTPICAAAEPTDAPTDAPTAAPTDAPTAAPTDAPTAAPTDAPTAAPTDAPTAAPTDAPTAAPTDAPTAAPTDAAPTSAPTDTSGSAPVSAPTEFPSVSLPSTGALPPSSGSNGVGFMLLMLVVGATASAWLILRPLTRARGRTGNR